MASPKHFKRLAALHRLTKHRGFLAAATILTGVVLLASPPLTRTLPYRAFLATITENAVVSRVNPVREASGVAPLRVDALLTEAARRKAEDMINRDYFSHIGPGNEAPWVWLDRVGYRYAAAGENLAIDFSDPDALIAAWLASPTHAANIRNGIFTEIGIGIASGDFQGRETTVVVMFLGRKLGTTLATVTREGTMPAPTPAPATPTPAPRTPPPAPPTPQPTPPTPQRTPQPNGTPQPEPNAVHIPEPREPLITMTTDTDWSDGTTPSGGGETPSVTTATPRWRIADVGRVLGFALVRATALLRIFLTVILGAILTASATLFAFPAHRRTHRFLPASYLFILLGLLWLPALL